MLRHACPALFAIVATTLPLIAQLRWETVPTPQAPAPRYDHATSGYGFLFGGRDTTQAFADTWNLEPWGWRQVATTQAPPPRHGHAMVRTLWFAGTVMMYDYMLFGGEDFAGTKDGSTWRFVGSYQPTGSYPIFTGNWQPLNLANAPSPRSGHAMVYDYWTETQCLLFGGSTASGASDETWMFANGVWQQLQPLHRPPARSGHVLLAAHEGGYVLLGGSDGNTVFNDCWWFDGSDWLLRPSQYPAGDTVVAWNNRARHAIVTNSVAGGAIVTQLHERTHTGEWLQQEQSGTLPARLGAAVFDAVDPQLLLLFGGRNAQGQVLGDTLVLAPEHVAATAQVGAGCGPGAWSNNGPDLFLSRVFLGHTGIMHIYTATPGALVVTGLQLGAAPAPAPCQITVVPELLVVSITNPLQMAEFPLAVPFSPALRGLQVSLQSLAFEPLSATGIAISRVGILTVGD